VQRSTCRICEARRPALVLDLGATALANRFLRPEQLGEPEPYYPLRLVLCPECGLVQLDEDVPPEVLFKDYLYVSGTSDAVARHSERLAAKLSRRYGLEAGDLVLEAGSNDGTLLRAFQKQDARVLGIEPAENLAQLARARRVHTVAEFFSERLAREIRAEHGTAKLFLARHVLAHVADLHDFVSGLRHVLDREGVAVIEVPHVADLLERLEFDTIYHEHRCYFSLEVLRRLFQRHGLALIDVERVALHGGSLLLQVAHANSSHAPGTRVAAMARYEERFRLDSPLTWQRFARRVADLRADIIGFMDEQHRRGVRLAGYGAAAKGNTLLAYCDIGRDRLPYIVDKSPHKQGLLTPGQHIPVESPVRLLRDCPDVTLVLAWNFADEIASQQMEYLARGGRFAVPIPLPQLVGMQEVAA